MKVKDLIQELSEFDPEMDVVVKTTDPGGYTYSTTIDSIDVGSEFDDNGFSGIDGHEVGEDDNNIGVVVIDLGIV